MLRLALLCFALTLLGAPLCAELIERYFPGKAEADVARDFESGLTDFFAARAKEPAKARVRVEINRKPVYLEIVDLTGDELVWVELICHGWYEEKLSYGYTPGDTRMKLKAADLPPAQVAANFNVPYRLPAEVVALAAWLAAKGELMLANAKLAELHAREEVLRSDIELWLRAKHGWAADAALQPVTTHNLREFEDGMLLLTAATVAERLKTLDADAKAALKELQALQGGDLRSAPGARKAGPTVRLDTLQSRIERYGKAYAGTATADSKGTQKAVDELLAAVKADRKWVEEQGFKADRMAIEGDKLGCADAWLLIVRADPENPNLLQKVAQVCTEAAGIKDGGLKADKPEKALKAAELWEKYTLIWPLMLNARNYAGMNYLAAGRKDKAKACFDEVVRRTDKPDLGEKEKQNRDYAQARLKSLK